MKMQNHREYCVINRNGKHYFLFKIVGIYTNYINIRESSSGLQQTITDCFAITWQLKK